MSEEQIVAWGNQLATRGECIVFIVIALGIFLMFLAIVWPKD